MKNKIKAVFFDIDGTLVSFKTHAVPESARLSIAQMRERGIKVFIATGRLLKYTGVVSDLEVDGYITVNGGYCITSSGEVIYECSIPPQIVEKVFELRRKYGFSFAILTEKGMYVERLEGRAKEVADLINIYPEVADLEYIASTQRVLQICPYIDPELEQVIMSELEECVSSRWIDILMDINMRGVDKSLAARHVMEYYGYTMQQAMAFGDGGNDLPMVRDVAVGVAMGNACEELKQVADYVTLSVDEDGVSHALRKYGLID